MAIQSATQIEKLVDITSGKHGGNEESREAHRKLMRNGRKEQQRMEVLALITESGGLSMKEVAQRMGVELNTVSGRGSELKKLGMVSPSGEIRNGSAVLVATGKTRLPEPATPTPVKLLKPMSPAEAKRELEALEHLYEHSTMTSPLYDAAQETIMERLGLWGQQ